MCVWICNDKPLNLQQFLHVLKIISIIDIKREAQVVEFFKTLNFIMVENCGLMVWVVWFLSSDSCT